MIQITNNSFKNNNFLFDAIRALHSTKICKSHKNNILGIVYAFNSFIDNHGSLLYFKQWPQIEISNCKFMYNKAHFLIYADNHYSRNDVQNGKIYIYNLTFHGNRLQQPTGGSSAAIRLRGNETTIHISNIMFTKNRGTSISLTNSILEIVGNITIDRNSAVTGGGLYIDRSVLHFADNDTKLLFFGNYATFGGAIYIEGEQDNCFLGNSSGQSIVLNGNTATVGPSIFFASNDSNNQCTGIEQFATSLPYSREFSISRTNYYS